MKIIVPLLDPSMTTAKVAIDSAIASFSSLSAVEVTIFHVKDDLFKDSVDLKGIENYLKLKLPTDTKYEIKIKNGVIPELELVREIKAQSYDKVLIHHHPSFVERFVNRIFHSDLVDVIKEEIPNPEIVSVLE